MKKTKPVYWIGNLDKGCDVCQQPFLDVMYDARTRLGVWGNLCEDCFKVGGCGLGVGYGQEYRRQPDGRYLCVGGLE